MDIAIITTENGIIKIDTPYSHEYKEELKDKIPWQNRNWNGREKVWEIDAEYKDAALSITKEFFSIEECSSDEEAEDAKIDAEIAEIAENQRFILENEDWINEAIEALDEAVARYSHNSKSRIKARMCKDRALLRHSLDNARIPISRLTELQVRGLAAAVRLIKNTSIRQLISR